jgi:hypothetical protein
MRTDRTVESNSHTRSHVDLVESHAITYPQVSKSRIYRTPSVTMISNRRDFIEYPQVKKSRPKSRTKSRTPLPEGEGCRQRLDRNTNKITLAGWRSP